MTEADLQGAGGRDGAGTAVHRDVVVIGASAGGVEALRQLVAGLPPELPAAVFVVLHVSPGGTSVLPQILARQTRMSVATATDGEAIQRGRIYVAPPDHHVLLDQGVVHLSRGPRENGLRPAVDPLFRSAARAYGPRVIGVVLSGALDDGADGLKMILEAGGAGVVQDPEEAPYPSMPRSALVHDHPRVARMADMAGVLCALLGEPPEAEAPHVGDPGPPAPPHPRGDDPRA